MAIKQLAYLTQTQFLLDGHLEGCLLVDQTNYRMPGEIGMRVTSKRELASVLNGCHGRDSDRLGEHLSEYELQLG